MKIVSCLAIVLFCSVAAQSQVTIPIDSVNNYVGKSVTVCSHVYGTKAFEKVTFLNLGARYPNSLITVAIFQKDIAAFSSAPAEMYSNKNICVTGEVKLYKGKAEIIVSKPGDIVMEKNEGADDR